MRDYDVHPKLLYNSLKRTFIKSCFGYLGSCWFLPESYLCVHLLFLLRVCQVSFVTRVDSARASIACEVAGLSEQWRVDNSACSHSVVSQAVRCLVPITAGSPPSSELRNLCYIRRTPAELKVLIFTLWSWSLADCYWLS